MLKTSLLALCAFALVISNAVVAAEDLEPVDHEEQTPTIPEAVENSPQEPQPQPQPQPTPWPEPFEIEASGGSCDPEDRCPIPLVECEDNSDCAAHCPFTCDPICVPVRMSICISLPPEPDKVCNCN